MVQSHKPSESLASDFIQTHCKNLNSTWCIAMLCFVCRKSQWLTLVALCYRVEAMRDILQKNQMVRAEFDRRKVAAVKIASWYKAILVERRRQQLLVTCIKLRKFVRPAIAVNRERARQACAARVLHFMKQLRDSNQVSLAVKRFKHMVVVIQRWSW